MSKKLVLFIPSIESGGVEKNFFNICNFLSHHYKKIFVITSDTKFKNNFEKNVILISPKSNYWAKKGRLKKTIISLFLLIKHFFNQEVVVFSFQSNIIAIVISKTKLIHAYGPMKKTIVMPIKETIDRIYKTANLKVIGIRRMI